MKRSGSKRKSSSGHTPTQCLNEIRERVVRMSSDQYRLFNEELLPALTEAGIHILKPDQLDPDQLVRLGSIFDNQIQPLLTPLAFSVFASRQTLSLSSA